LEWTIEAAMVLGRFRIKVRMDWMDTTESTDMRIAGLSDQI